MKRADLPTRTVLEAVRDGAAWGTLARHYPPKVVLAALNRELRSGHIEYGTSIASPWLTRAGQKALAEQEPS